MYINEMKFNTKFNIKKKKTQSLNYKLIAF